MYKRIILKIGSGVISNNGLLDEKVVKEIVRQIGALRRKGVGVVLVTSGAVATGKKIVKVKKGADEIVQKQVFAAVGQVRLMSIYAALFAKQKQACAQVLVTKEDFRDRQHYLNMKNCLENLLRSDIVPVVNENDVIAVTELVFTDNDELAALLASQLGAEALIILTSVGGVLRGRPDDPGAEVISRIESDDGAEKYITDERSSSGRGGMHTKFAMAKKLAAQGIAVHIANGKKKDTVTRIVAGEPVGTTFIPARKLSAAKRRIAHSEGLAKGSAYVNECTEDLLLSRKVASLLPVGILRIEGTFEKGDVIEIKNEKGRRLGFGIARYDSLKARTLRGKKKAPALVHYDYLFIQ